MGFSLESVHMPLEISSSRVWVSPMGKERQRMTDRVGQQFGIAVVMDTLTSLSEQKMAGTPVYMAPEQIQDQPCAASDQYALGVIVYEWLCGEPPFRGPLMAIL